MDEADRPRRRGIRLRDYDYAQPGAYMVTVCIHDRLSLLGSIDQGEATVTAGGDAVAGCWRRLPRQFGNLVLDEWIIMPDHIHGILIMEDQVSSRGTHEKAWTLGGVVGAFKSTSTRAYMRGVREAGWPRFNGRLWRRSYYDSVIRNEGLLERARSYIRANPERWVRRGLA